MCPTSELPICPAGSPTASPDAFSVVCGYRSIRRVNAGVRASAEDLGGSATLFRTLPGTTARIWPAAQPAVQALNARIRASFDPSGLFNPGRLDG